ncbi:MAG: hypothetical protein KME15_03265 [Drouetiella hepatica Uher 2000/2452]|uniref:DUF7734 domain-containing protein n=1 Tax=Drouetiella hepatica Uher 2000/2452 TaxID=904376 RepID=A0A951UMA6_9CYAN|nr:hypothetical protein [Drouetiella hepatica Uher 2000/2452]
MNRPIAFRLEQYTLKRPQEVLLVTAEIAGEADEIMIFKGFSSSLMRSTAYDPDVPMLPEAAKIVAIDRLVAPYQPDRPQYIQQGLTWVEMQDLLATAGV